MEIGHVIDYVAKWNEIHEPIENEKGSKKKKTTRRRASQADWNAFLG